MRISSVKPVPWLAVNLHHLLSNEDLPLITEPALLYLGSYLALSLDNFFFCSQNLFAQYICTFASCCDINNNSTANSTFTSTSSVSSVCFAVCVIHLISVELLCDWFVAAGRNEKPFGNLQNMTVNLLVMSYSESFCSFLLAFILNKWLSCHHIWCHLLSKSQMWLHDGKDWGNVWSSIHKRDLKDGPSIYVSRVLLACQYSRPIHFSYESYYIPSHCTWGLNVIL